MVRITSIKIPKFSFHEPRKNFPKKSSRINKERNFTLKFARAYISQIVNVHRKTTKDKIDFAREIPINGFGIADFVSVSWNPRMIRGRRRPSNSDEFIIQASPVVRAFEMKISNWRKALLQAHRYRYFADASIVVIPSEKLKIAKSYIETFKKIKIGLWGFDPKSNRITIIYTPRPKKPFKEKYKSHVIKLVSITFKSQHSF